MSSTIPERGSSVPDRRRELSNVSLVRAPALS